VRYYLLICLAIVALIAFAKDGKAHDPYTGWMRPGTTMSCCNKDDCRPTRAYLGDDGIWRAWDGDKWLLIPAHALLPTDYAKDGRSHLCEKNGMIFCFTPGPVRS
jgi:hypothetical protein